MLIGLVGHARVGKDTVAARLTENHGFTRVAFADTLRDVLYDAEPYCDACIDDDGDVMPFTLSEVVDTLGWEEAKEVNPEVRRLLQNFGQAIREVDPDFWLRAGVWKINHTPGDVVVTDVRYRNEADAIRELGGVLCRVTRPGKDGANGHISEHELDALATEATLPNDADVDALHAQVDRLVDTLRYLHY